MKRNKGATLLEVVVAMTLIFMLTLGVITVAETNSAMTKNTLIKYAYSKHIDNVLTAFQVSEHSNNEIDFETVLSEMYDYYEDNIIEDGIKYFVYFDVSFNQTDNQNYYYTMDITRQDTDLTIKLYKYDDDKYTQIYQSPTYKAGRL